jgi:hypothetical protein
MNVKDLFNLEGKTAIVNSRLVYDRNDQVEHGPF